MARIYTYFLKSPSVYMSVHPPHQKFKTIHSYSWFVPKFACMYLTRQCFSAMTSS